MKIAGDICVYTNHNIIVQKLEPKIVEPSTTTTTTTTPPTTPESTVV